MHENKDLKSVKMNLAFLMKFTMKKNAIVKSLIANIFHMPGAGDMRNQPEWKTPAIIMGTVES